MSYKDDETIKKDDDYFNCPKCGAKYDEEEARILPCGDIFCSKCMLTLLNPITDHQPMMIECPICLETIRFDYEYPAAAIRNNRLLIKRESLKSKLQTLVAQLNEKKLDLDRNFEIGAKLLRNHCSELKSQINIATEVRLAEIRQRRDRLLLELDKYETECVRKMSARVKDEAFQVEIGHFKAEITETLNRASSSSTISETYMSDSLKVAQYYLRILRENLSALESLIFMEAKPVFVEEAISKGQIGGEANYLLIGQICFSENYNNGTESGGNKCGKRFIETMKTEKMKNIELKSIERKISVPKMSVNWFQSTRHFVLFNYETEHNTTQQAVVIFDRTGRLLSCSSKAITSPFNNNSAILMNLVKTAIFNDVVFFLYKKKPKTTMYFGRKNDEVYNE